MVGLTYLLENVALLPRFRDPVEHSMRLPALVHTPRGSIIAQGIQPLDKGRQQWVKDLAASKGLARSPEGRVHPIRITSFSTIFCSEAGPWHPYVRRQWLLPVQDFPGSWPRNMEILYGKLGAWPIHIPRIRTYKHPESNWELPVFGNKSNSLQEEHAKTKSPGFKIRCRRHLKGVL